MKIGGRAEPTSVAKGVDELWIEVKCLSNSEIAGSPRNSFRASHVLILVGEESCLG